MQRLKILLALLLSLALMLAACTSEKKEIPTIVASPMPAAKAKFFDAQNQLKKYEKSSSQADAARGVAVYKIAKETYIVNDDKMDVAINYPQISNLGDGDRQKKINELLKKEALQILARYANNGLSLAVHYKITWQSDNLLSIQYTGMGCGWGTAHPNHHFYTTNVDISKGNKLRLQDLVIIDENFVNKFRDENIKTVSPHPGALSGKEIFIEHTPFKALDETIALFNKADIVYPDGRLPRTYCYFTPEAFGISTETAHAIGDHAEFEIKYEDMAKYIKAENDVWKDFFTGLRSKQ